MSDRYHCPRCASGLTKTSRNLDFFCRGCFTSVVILDPEWADIMSVEDAAPTRIRVEACLRHRGTEPLIATCTKPLEAIAS
jgi:hypothetical protein